METGTPEQVAFNLLHRVATTGGKNLTSAGGSGFKDAAAARKWILDTYAECLTVVRNPEGRLHRSKQAESVGQENPRDQLDM